MTNCINFILIYTQVSLLILSVIEPRVQNKNDQQVATFNSYISFNKQVMNQML